MQSASSSLAVGVSAIHLRHLAEFRQADANSDACIFSGLGIPSEETA
jgi:hypothetical protein